MVWIGSIFIWAKVLKTSRLLRNLKRYIFRNSPFELTIFLTSYCNFRCAHCFYLDSLNKKEMLTIEEYLKFAASMPKLERLLFTGGEPFMRDDIDEIISTFCEKTEPLFVTIPTNGYFSSDIIVKTENILKRAKYPSFNISLSVDDIYEKRDEFVRKNGSYEALLNTSEGLHKLKERYSNLSITVITTQTKENENRLYEIFEEVKKTIKPDYYGFNPSRESSTDTDSTKIDPGKYAAFCDLLMKYHEDSQRQMKKMPFKSLFLANKELVYKRTYKTLREKKYQSKCISVKIRAVVLENGDVYPCETLMDKGGKFLIGNLNDYGMNFSELWNSERRKNVLKEIIKERCFCTHGCDITLNALYDFKSLLGIIKNSSKYYNCK